MEDHTEKSLTRPSVAHLSSAHPPFSTRILRKECRSLATAGYQVSYIVPHDKDEIVDGVHLIPVRKYPSRPGRMTRGVKAVYDEAVRLDAALYHFHDPEYLIAAMLLKQRTGAKVIYDVHENYAVRLGGRSWARGPFKRTVPWLVGRLEQVAARRFDGIVAVTDHIAALFPPSKTIVVQNYPLVNLARAVPSQATYSPDNRQLIYTGGWTEHRGIYQIVEALGLAKTPGLKLRLMGRLSNPEVRDRASALSGYSRLEYLGLVSFEQVYAEMRNAAVGLVCNQPDYDYERAQPNKLFEYMSAGLPVIASDFPKWRTIVEGTGCGITVDPTSPEAIAEAVDYLLGVPELRREMGLKGVDAVVNVYNWDVEARKLVDLYGELLGPC